MIISPEQIRLLNSLSLPVMVLDREFRFRYFNAAYLETVQRDGDDLLGKYVFDEFPETPDRIESVLGPWRRTLEGESTTLEALPFHVQMPDGSMQERVWQAVQDPVRDRTGEIVGLLQRTQDITEQYLLEQRNIAIGHELSHRVKNIMAVVSSVARITGRTAGSVPDFVQRFTARLNAMSRTADLLAEGDWIGLDVGTILRDELSPYEDADVPVYTLKGEQIRLSVDASKDLSMVCHELATNAAKYGCLGSEGGKLSISWSRADSGLVLYWKESCPTVTDPKTGEPGFGTRLFEMLPYAKVDRQFTPTGLHLTITMDGEKLFA